MKFPIGEEAELYISKIAYKGQGVARADDGFVIFVNGALPEETATIRITKAKKRYREAGIVRVIEPSPYRVEPKCRYFGVCGGCIWQNMSYEGQLASKRMEVDDSFRHIGGLGDLSISTTMGMDDPWHYRNRMDFSFADIEGCAVIGLHKRRSFADIVPIAECLILDERSIAVIETVNKWSAKHGLPAYDALSNSGILRTIVMRFSHYEPEMMVDLVTTSALEDISVVGELAETIRPTSFWHTINDSKNDSQFSGRSHISGERTIRERLGGVEHTISPASFFQTNTVMAERLFEAAVSETAPDCQGLALDLFSGTGTIALALAKIFRHVIGVESVAQSVLDAQNSADINGLSNVSFIAAPVEKSLDDILEKNNDIRATFINPPRAGLHPKALKAVCESKLSDMTYISCNPTTLARDCAGFAEYGFRIDKIQPVDMFPHTYHVETICRLVR